jgi:thioredoxin 1
MSNVVNVENNNLTHAEKMGTHILLDFWTATCGPCRMLTPVLEAIAAENVGKLVLAKIESSGNQLLMEHHKVVSVPTVILLVNGVETHRVVGFRTKEELLIKLGLNAP